MPRAEATSLELEDLIEDPLDFNDGRLKVPGKSGLGLELNDRKLKKLAVGW